MMFFKFISFLAIVYIFYGCSDVPEGGVPLKIDDNKTFLANDKNISTSTEEKPKETEDKKQKEESEKVESLSLTSSSSMSLEKGTSSTVNFLLRNYKSDTKLLTSTSSNFISISSPSCRVSSPIVKTCSVKIEGKNSGSGTALIYISGKRDIKLSISVTVKEPEKKVESLTLLSLSSITLDINGSSDVSFTLQNYSSDTKLLTSTSSNFISIANPSCVVSTATEKICSTKIVGKSSGSGTALIYVSGKRDIRLSISVTVSKSNISDSNISDSNISDSNISDSNISDSNISDSNISDSNISDNNISDSNISSNVEFLFVDGQERNLTIKSGESFLVTTVVINPRDENESIKTSTTGDGVSSIIKTYLDKNISSDNRYIFRTEIETFNYGEDRINLELIDSNLSLMLNLKVISEECNFDADEFKSIDAGEVRDEVVFGAKLGFNSVKLIYPRLQSYRGLKPQNFTYILDGGDGKTEHSNVGNNSFAFIKFSEDLVGEDYKIHYRKDGSKRIVCLVGVFPDIDLIETESDNRRVEEEAPPSSPTE